MTKEVKDLYHSNVTKKTPRAIYVTDLAEVDLVDLVKA